MNRKYLDQYYYNEIKNLLTEDLIQKYDNIDIQELSLNSIEKNISELDKNKLKEINDKFSNIQGNNITFKPEEVEIILLNSKKIKIYKK